MVVVMKGGHNDQVVQRKGIAAVVEVHSSYYGHGGFVSRGLFNVIEVLRGKDRYRRAGGLIGDTGSVAKWNVLCGMKINLKTIYKGVITKLL